MKQVDSLVDNVKRGTIIPSLIMVLIGLLMIAMMHVIIKYLDGYHGSFLTMTRSVTGMMLLLVLLFVQHDFDVEKRYVWKVAHLHWLITRSFCVVAADVAFFVSLHHIELGTARALNYSSAIFIAFFGITLFKEKCDIWRIGALIIGFLGMFMIVNQGAEIEYENLKYYFIAIFSGFAFAGTLILLKFFSKKADHFVLMFYGQAATTVLSILVLSMFFEWQAIKSVEDAALILLLGIFGTVGVLLMAYAYRMVEASLLAPFQYFGLIFALVSGWIFFSENPWDKLFPGALLIVGAGLVTAVHEHIHKVAAMKQAEAEASGQPQPPKESMAIVKKIAAIAIVKKIIATAPAKKSVATATATAKKSTATVTAKKTPTQKTTTAKKSTGTAKKKSTAKAKPKNVKK